MSNFTGKQKVNRSGSQVMDIPGTEQEVGTVAYGIQTPGDQWKLADSSQILLADAGEIPSLGILKSYTFQNYGLPDSSARFSKIASNGEVAVALADNAGDARKRFYSSVDGINWTLRYSASYTLSDIIWHAGFELFIGLGGDGKIYTSANGADWTVIETGATSAAALLTYNATSVGFTSWGGSANIVTSLWISTDGASFTFIPLGTRATAVLTATDNFTNQETVQIAGPAGGNKLYRFRPTLSTAYATGLLTCTGNFSQDETTVFGSKTYTWKDTLAAVAATGILTATANFADGEYIQIPGQGGYYYFDAILSDDFLPHVLIGATLQDTLNNLTAALNGGAGAGTLYTTGGSGALVDFTASNDATTLTLTANVAGSAYNSTALIEGAANANWDAGYTSGGADAAGANTVLVGATLEDSLDNLTAAIMDSAGEGTVYGTGTTANLQVHAVNDATTLTPTAISVGTGGNSIATTEACANASFGSVHLNGGLNASVANEVLIGATLSDSLANIAAAINAGAGIGTVYATGTVNHEFFTAESDATTLTISSIYYGTRGNTGTLQENAASASWSSLGGGAADLQGGLMTFVASDDVIVGYHDGDNVPTTTVYISDDHGVTWTPKTITTSGSGITAISFANEIFVGIDYANHNTIVTAPSDGSAWAEVQTDTIWSSNYYPPLSFANGKYFLAGYASDYNTPQLFVSDDGGATWVNTIGDLPTTEPISGLAEKDGVYVILTNNNDTYSAHFYSSPDLITWTRLNTGKVLTDSYANILTKALGKFIIFTANDDNAQADGLSISDDGTTVLGVVMPPPVAGWEDATWIKIAA